MNSGTEVWYKAAWARQLEKYSRYNNLEFYFLVKVFFLFFLAVCSARKTGKSKYFILQPWMVLVSLRPFFLLTHILNTKKSCSAF